ncbi:HotDog domain-containing protein [Aspergillus unguis]
MHPAAQSTHLVKTALVNTQRLTVDPIFFLKSKSQSGVQSQSASTQIIAATYISRHTTGHAGFVHGGLSTLLLDDIFARLAAEIFPSRIGMTARLGMDFRAPGLPERVYILRAVLDRVEGERRNKVWMKGEMRCLGGFQVEEMAKRGIVEGDGVSEEEQEGVLVARAEGLFVEPRDVKGMVPLYPREEGAL